MKKRIASLLAALALCLTLLPMAAFAEDAAPDAWDGTADTSWYVGHESDTAYHITTAEQLAGLAEIMTWTWPGTSGFLLAMVWLSRMLLNMIPIGITALTVRSMGKVM